MLRTSLFKSDNQKEDLPLKNFKNPLKDNKYQDHIVAKGFPDTKPQRPLQN